MSVAIIFYLCPYFIAQNVENNTGNKVRKYISQYQYQNSQNVLLCISFQNLLNEIC